MLLHEQNRGRERTGTGLDQAILQHRGNLCFNFLFLKVWVLIWSHVYGCSLRQQMDMVVSFSSRRHGMEGMKQGTKLNE